MNVWPFYSGAYAGTLVQKRHCGRHSIDGRRFALEESREISACGSLSGIVDTRSVFGGLAASALSRRTGRRDEGRRSAAQIAKRRH